MKTLTPRPTRKLSPVRSSVWFGNPRSIGQKSPAFSVRNRRDGRPCHRARKCTHEIREAHEKNLRHRRDTSQPANSKGGNRENRGSSLSPFPDTVSRVIQPRARRAPGSSPQPSVNNSAEPEMKSSEKLRCLLFKSPSVVRSCRTLWLRRAGL